MRVPVYDLFCEGHIRRSSQSGPAKHEVKCGCQRIGTDGVSCSRQKPSRLAPRSIARYVVIRYLASAVLRIDCACSEGALFAGTHHWHTRASELRLVASGGASPNCIRGKTS